MEKPVIVAASYGGNYAIPYLMEPEADTCYQRARGFVPIATTSTGRYKPAQYHRCSVSVILNSLRVLQLCTVYCTSFALLPIFCKSTTLISGAVHAGLWCK